MKNNIDTFDMNSIPLISKNIAFREDENGILIFQIDTDEMYFISHAVFPLIELCNGANSCQDILDILRKNENSTPDIINNSFVMFVKNLLSREIISLL